MRRKVLARALVAAVLLAAPTARAQPMMGGGGGGRMPDLSQIVGRPLPDGGMPTGTVSVRVARKMPVNAVAGAEVSAIIKNAGGDLRKRALKTDASGRVLFEGMAPGDQFHAEVTVDGERLETQPFAIPSEGGIKTMLISGVLGGANRGGEPAGGGPADESPAGGDEKRAFSLGATAGVAQEDASLPAGTFDLVLRDENGAPIADHPVVLGMVNKQGEVESRRGKTDGAGRARFTDLPTGKQSGYAAVIDWHGLRLSTAPFAMPESGGARAEIRALTRSADPSAITIGAGARIVVQMAEDRLQILEFLPLENTSEKMFDPSPGAFEIPLPTGFTGAQPQENDRKIDVRQDHGIAVHGPIVPKRSQLGVSANERQADEIVFGFELHYYGDSHVFSQPVPNGIGSFTLITDQKVSGLTLSGPGLSAREERVLNGRKYWIMGAQAVPPGGSITFTINGIPATDASGRWISGILSVLLIIGAVVFLSVGPRRGGARDKRGTAADERARLVEQREALFTELVTMERTSRAAGLPAPAEKREQLVARLEQVYQDMAALEEPRAA
jgi:hypothetical protein